MSENDACALSTHAPEVPEPTPAPGAEPEDCRKYATPYATTMIPRIATRTTSRVVLFLMAFGFTEKRAHAGAHVFEQLPVGGGHAGQQSHEHNLKADNQEHGREERRLQMTRAGAQTNRFVGSATHADGPLTGTQFRCGIEFSYSGAEKMENDGASSNGLASSIVALPSSEVVVANGNHLVAYTPGGKEAWSFTLPDGDTVASPPVGAASSTTYVRGAHRLYAFAPDGTLLWQTKHQDASAMIKGIVAMGDSTVSVTAEDDLLVNYGPDGRRRWIFALPDGDRMSAPPVVAPSSMVYLRGSKRIYAVGSSGTLVWQADLKE